MLCARVEPRTQPNTHSISKAMRWISGFLAFQWWSCGTLRFHSALAAWVITLKVNSST